MADEQDPFCYPGTSVLINRLDIRDPVQLADTERKLVARQAEKHPADFTISYTGYKALHRHLFGDLYEWAGKSRAELTTIEGRVFQPPPVISKGNTVFQPAIRFFEQELER